MLRRISDALSRQIGGPAPGRLNDPALVLGLSQLELLYCSSADAQAAVCDLFRQAFVREIEPGKSERIFCPVGLMAGAPGIGKSRMAVEILNMARQLDASVLDGCSVWYLLTLSLNSCNLPTEEDVSLGVPAMLGLRMLHAAFVHPRTSFSAFLHQLMAQEQLSILSLANLTPPDALAIVRARLAVPAPDRCVGGLSSPPPI